MNARGKVSSVTHNVANLIHNHVRSTWPELAAVEGVWFTGSRIWSWLYGGVTFGPGTDWDAFVMRPDVAESVADRLGLRRLPSIRTQHKRTADESAWTVGNVPILDIDVQPGCGIGYSEGFCYRTARGQLDLWIAEPGGVLAEIRSYPTASHAHCRAAYSLIDGLVVLPNEAAR